MRPKRRPHGPAGQSSAPGQQVPLAPGRTRLLAPASGPPARIQMRGKPEEIKPHPTPSPNQECPWWWCKWGSTYHGWKGRTEGAHSVVIRIGRHEVSHVERRRMRQRLQRAACKQINGHKHVSLSIDGTRHTPPSHRTGSAFQSFHRNTGNTGNTGNMLAVLATLPTAVYHVINDQIQLSSHEMIPVAAAWNNHGGGVARHGAAPHKYHTQIIIKSVYQ